MIDIKGHEIVYKYISLKYLLSLIEKRKLRLDTVSSWQDPYENFLLKSNFHTYLSLYKQDVPVCTDEMRKRIYGQSWTKSEESDAMWRIYSRDKDAVRIKVKVQNLFDIVYTHDKCMATTFIGTVKYQSDKKITDWIKKLDLKNPSSFQDYIRDSLFIKRMPFIHESEVRLIISKDTQAPAEEFLEYDIADLNFIEEFVLDPRLDLDKEQGEVEKITHQLCEVGVDVKKIKKSDLYDFRPVDLEI